MEHKAWNELEKAPTEERASNRIHRKKQKKGNSFVLQLLLVVAFALILRNFIIGTVYVKGSSMEPNFHHGDLVFINKLALKAGTPKRGDIIICRLHEDGREENIIKRVIGLPGDRVNIVWKGDDQDGAFALYLNGELIEEPFLGEPMMTGGNMEYPFLVPENSYFVMGDNRNASTDSRKKTVGAIPKADLVGKVVFRLYPFDGFGFVK